MNYQFEHIRVLRWLKHQLGLLEQHSLVQLKLFNPRKNNHVGLISLFCATRDIKTASLIIVCGLLAIFGFFFPSGSHLDILQGVDMGLFSGMDDGMMKADWEPFRYVEYSRKPCRSCSSISSTHQLFRS